MSEKPNMTRRSMIQTAAAGAGVVLTGAACAAEAGCGGSCRPTKTVAVKVKGVAKLKNSDFYDSSGKFDGKKAKSAYFAMFKRFGYPIVEKLRTDEMWAIDFALGDFVNVGMGGIFWWNNKKQGFFGHEIYLLPGQMIVEHAHVKTPEGPPKMEAWHVRHGMIYTFGEGDPTTPAPVKTPASQDGHITVKKIQSLKPGDVAELNRPTAKHFMLAGPEGAIVSEYATYHDGAGLRFTNPDVRL